MPSRQINQNIIHTCRQSDCDIFDKLPVLNSKTRNSHSRRQKDGDIIELSVLNSKTVSSLNG